jgi:hypothetical protein
MPSGGGFIAGYNGQIAVDAAHQTKALDAGNGQQDQARRPA